MAQSPRDDEAPFERRLREGRAARDAVLAGARRKLAGYPRVAWAQLRPGDHIAVLEEWARPGDPITQLVVLDKRIRSEPDGGRIAVGFDLHAQDETIYFPRGEFYRLRTLTPAQLAQVRGALARVRAAARARLAALRRSAGPRRR